MFRQPHIRYSELDPTSPEPALYLPQVSTRREGYEQDEYAEDVRFGQVSMNGQPVVR